MKKLFINTFALTLMLFSIQVYAATITMSPANAGGTSPLTPGMSEQVLLNSTLGVTVGDLLYKAEVGGSDDGTFATSYSTTFLNSSTQPKDAIISYDSGSMIDCSATNQCFVSVKDGNQTPGYYFFEISLWDGLMNLIFEDFWPNQGSISHIAIYQGTGGTGVNPPQVPVPAAVWLFGSGILGVIGFSRRKSTSAVKG